MSGSPPSRGREVATRVLFRVATKGAWAAPALDAETRRAGLDARDAALAAEIVYGALRVCPRLDATVDAHRTRRGTRVDDWARAAMRAGTYQLLHLDRVPAHAAVDDAVALVRRERGTRVAGFVNAVLRKVAAARPEVPGPVSALVAPDWLTREMERALGAARSRAFLSLRPLPPPIGLRVVRGERSEISAAIRGAAPGAEVWEGRISSQAVLVRRAGDPRRLPGYEDGRFVVQEEGSQVVGQLADAQPGERVLDACAGRGGKTLQLAAAVGERGHVTAVDIYETKLEHIAVELGRLGIPLGRVDTVPLDLSIGTGGLQPAYDRVLVDAPCTNLGTIHRRPELLLRTGPGDGARMAELQGTILRHALELVRPGGTLVYAVCSPTRAEGIGVVQRFEAECGERLERTGGPWPGGWSPDEDGLIRLGPWLGDTDAYQLAHWKKAAVVAESKFDSPGSSG